MDYDISRERIERFLVCVCILGGILMMLIVLYKAVQPYFLGLLEKSHESAAFFVLKMMFSVTFIMFGLYIWISKKISLIKETTKTLKQAADMKRQYKAELAAKDAENEALKARVAELGKAPQKAAQGANKSHAGSETASAKRIAEWKEAYIPAMVKAAIELGAEGPKPERERKQRKDIGALLDRFAVQGKAHPSDCPEAVDVFRASLPDGYVNTTGGAPKSRANKINQ